MISKNDCMMLLSSLSKQGIDTKTILKQLVLQDNVDISILNSINKLRPLDLIQFYEMLRKNYNNGKSKIYINIMKEFDENNVEEVLTTLNSYAQQILLFSRTIDNREMFFRFSRLSEVYQCLYAYSVKYNLTPCIQLLKLIKTDLKAIETIYRK